MATIWDGARQAVIEDKTFEVLDAIKTVLGSTKSFMWPFLESAGTRVTAYREDHDLTSSDEASSVALESEFSPYRHPGGIYSYHFETSGNNHLAGSDDDDLSYGNGTADNELTVGAWIYPHAAVITFLSKYDQVGGVREWHFSDGGGQKVRLELYDESANANIVGTSDTLLTLNKWSFIVATYDATEAAAGISLYLDGVDDGLTTGGSGSYVAMENTATPLLIGARDTTAAPVNEFHGRIALPFVTAKELSAAEVGHVYALSRKLIGV